MRYMKPHMKQCFVCGEEGTRALKHMGPDTSKAQLFVSELLQSNREEM